VKERFLAIEIPMTMSKRKHKDERRKAQLKAKFRQEKRQSTKSYQEQREIESLLNVIASGAPTPGSNPLSLEQAVPGSYAGVRSFEELPLSSYTKAALKEAGYVTMTAIQRAALPHALAGRDILGAAKTGSGKTLCFLIPVSECLKLIGSPGWKLRVASTGNVYRLTDISSILLHIQQRHIALVVHLYPAAVHLASMLVTDDYSRSETSAAVQHLIIIGP
jgi:hypothetical protein